MIEKIVFGNEICINMTFFGSPILFHGSVKEVILGGMAYIEFDIVGHNVFCCKIQQVVKINILFCFCPGIFFCFFRYFFDQCIKIKQFGLFFYRGFRCGDEKIELFNDIFIVLGSSLNDLFHGRLNICGDK